MGATPRRSVGGWRGGMGGGGWDGEEPLNTHVHVDYTYMYMYIVNHELGHLIMLYTCTCSFSYHSTLSLSP